MSKIGKSIPFIIIFGVLLAACAPQLASTPNPVPSQGNNPFASQNGDGMLMRGDAEIVSASILAEESFPPRIFLTLAYRLPTACHKLRVNISQPDNQNRIQLVIYSVAPKDKPCNMMMLLTPQEARVDLGSFSGGHYTVWVNGEKVGAFDS